MNFRFFAPFLIAGGVMLAQAPQPPQPGQAKPQRRPGGGMSMPQPLTDETGFKPIFDGKTLTGWDGDSSFWKVADGAITGQTTAENPLKQNTFLIWRGGSPGDFELKLEYRLSATNSGVQVRSVELPDMKWVLKGYQADIDSEQRFTGQIYEERGRGFLALRGQMSYIGEGQKSGVVASLGDGDVLKALIKPAAEWNHVHIIARGNTLTNIWNGHVMSSIIDDDTANRVLKGLIGFQIHVGPPMTVEFRNIRLKTY